MTAITSFKQLIVWQKSMDLVKEVHVVAKSMPKSETLMIIAQILQKVLSETIGLSINSFWVLRMVRQANSKHKS